jgi:hypothetical protein
MGDGRGIISSAAFWALPLCCEARKAAASIRLIFASVDSNCTKEIRTFALVQFFLKDSMNGINVASQNLMEDVSF